MASAGQRYVAEIQLRMDAAQVRSEMAALKRDALELARQSANVLTQARGRTSPTSVLGRQLTQEQETATNPLYAGVGNIQKEAGARAAAIDKQISDKRQAAGKKAADIQAEIASIYTNIRELANKERGIEGQLEKNAQEAKHAYETSKELLAVRNELINKANKQIREANALGVGETRQRNISKIAQGEVASSIVGSDIHAEIERQKAASEEYIKAVVGLRTAMLQRRSAIDNELAGSDQFIEAEAESVTAKRRLSAKLNEELAGSDAYLKAQAESTAAIRRRAANEKAAISETLNRPENADILTQEARNKITGQQDKAAANQRYFDELDATAGGQAGLAKELGEARGRTEIFNRQTQAAAAALKGTEANARLLGESEATLAKTTATLNAAKSKAILAQVEGDEKANRKSIPQLQAEGAQAQGAVDARRLVASREALLADEATIKLKARANVLQSQINQKLAAQERAIAGQTLGGGTRTQNILQRLAAREGRDIRPATEYQTLGQVAGSALVTTAKFAAAGSIFFGISTAIKQSFDEAKKLETEFAILKTTLNNVGRGAEFDELKAGLFAISRETGIATSELAGLAVQLRAAFSTETASFVTKQVEAAAQIERVTGLSTTETTDSLTAISKTFGVSIRTIGDTAAGLQQRFGVLSKEIITFSADLAPVAEQAGLSFEKLAAIGASVQQLSGRSGAGLAESLGRVFAGLQDNAGTIISVFQTNAKLASSAGEVAENLARGRTGPVLELLIKNYDKLTKAQQNNLNSALGGSRQAPVLAALFQGDPIKKELDRINQGGSDAGKLKQQFQALQETIGQMVAQIKQVFLQLGVGIAETGIIPVLKELINGIQTFVTIMHPVASTVRDLNDALGGLGTKLLAVYAAFRLIRGLGSITGLFKAGAGGAAASGLFGRVLGTAAVPALSGGVGVQTAGVAGTGLRGLGSAYAAGGIGGFGSAAAGGVTGALASVLPSTAAGGLALGAVVSYELVKALSSGYQKGVDEAIAKAKQDAPKQATTAKGLRLAQTGTKPNIDVGAFEALATGKPVEFHSLGEAATNVKNAALGQAGKEELLQDEYQKAVGSAFIAQIKAVTSLKGLKNPRELLKSLGGSATIQSREGHTNATIDAVDPTDDESFIELKKVHDRLVKKYGKDYIDGVIKAANKQIKGKKLAAGIRSGDIESDEQLLSDKRSAYDAGVISEQQLLGAQNKVIGGLQGLVNTGAATPKQLAEYFKAKGEQGKLLSDIIKSDLDNAKQIRSFTGGDDSQANIDEAITALRDPRLTDRGDRTAIISGIFDDYKHILQTRMNAVGTAAEKLAIGQQGVEIAGDVQIEIARVKVASALEQSKSFARLILFAASRKQGIGELETDITALSLFLGITVGAAVQLFLKIQLQEAIDTLNGMLTALSYAHTVKKGAQKAIDAQKAAIAAAFGALVQAGEAPETNFVASAPGSVTASPEEQAALTTQAAKDAEADAKSAAEAAKALRAAQADYLKALVEGDPVAEAEIALQQAQADVANAADETERWTALAALVRAQHALTDATNAVTTARLGFLQSLVSNDPVASAELEIRKAYTALVNAKGEAARYDAAAALNAAGQAYKQTLFDVVSSSATLAEAVANFSGDLVSVARLTLDELRRKLAYATSTGAGAEAINGIRADIINQQAQLRDAQLKEKEDTIDFNLQTQKISTAQAVAQYQALLNNADVLGLTIQERRDLILKIQQLKQGLNQDLQFDLPSDLRLPTLYEARRLNQSGGNYQDNRVIEINLSSTDPASTEAAVSQIQDALNAPAVFGSGSRIY